MAGLAGDQRKSSLLPGGGRVNFSGDEDTESWKSFCLKPSFQLGSTCRVHIDFGGGHVSRHVLTMAACKEISTHHLHLPFM